jgi:hypothetical protein
VEDMSGTGQTRRGTVAARLLPLLAVMLGLLAMHGLASTHHAAAAPARAGTPSAVAAVDSPPAVSQHRHGPQEHDRAASGAPAATAMAGSLLERAVTGPAVPGCSDECTDGLAVLCAAVLAATAAAVWLSAAAARRPVPAPTRRDPRPRATARARRLPPRLDPVAELCVSRT